eukprot:TRINITY_DN9454_c0_g2_i1.p4 TRINITY_DN9454_c0_g2~~TRINITY_DN9454_c0_g2_i1.p4  ORF type:complete len:103 (+),score=38.42 TRINITY_DN9454_c0_g2_i1:1009-1317(+)
MVRYCRGLKFEEAPNYEYLHGLIKNVFAEMQFEFDSRYDWMSFISVPTESSVKALIITENSKHLLQPAKKAFAENKDEKEIVERKGRPGNNLEPGKGLIIEA